MAFDDGELREVARRVGHDAPAGHRRRLVRLGGDELAGDDPHHAHVAPARRAEVERRVAERRDPHRVADPAGHLGRREGHGHAVARRHTAAGDDERRAEALEVLEHDHVGAEAGRDRAQIREAMAARAVQRGHHQHVLGRDPVCDGRAAHGVDVAHAQELVRLLVVGAERAVLGPVAADELEQVDEVARVGGLAQQHPDPAAALLERLLPGRGLVVGGDPGRRVGVELAAGHARRVAVDVRMQRHLGEDVRVAGDDRREVHDLGDADRALVLEDARPCRPRSSAPRGDSSALAGTHEGAIA